MSDVSAWVVDKAHIDVLLTAARLPGRVQGSPLRWLRSTNPPEWAELAPIGTGELNRIGGVLVAENVRSVVYRYEDAEGMIPAYALAPYEHRAVGFEPTPGEVFNAIDCLEYQSCEHSEWESSEAYRFLQALAARTQSRVDGYDTAPWGWTTEAVLRRRRGNVVPLR